MKYFSLLYTAAKSFEQHEPVIRHLKSKWRTIQNRISTAWAGIMLALQKKTGELL